MTERIYSGHENPGRYWRLKGNFTRKERTDGERTVLEDTRRVSLRKSVAIYHTKYNSFEYNQDQIVGFCYYGPK